MKHVMMFCVLLLLVGSSCAKLVPVPGGDLKEAGRGRKDAYRLTTRDDVVYEFKKFEATDSALVILEVTSYSKNPSLYTASQIKVPVIVSWKDVESLERIEHDYILSVLVAAAAGAVMYGITVIFFGVGFS